MILDSHGYPVIIIGMHRSGTTMITKFLMDLGLFIGKDLERNYESKFFMRENVWMLRSSGGTWDTPRCIEYMYNHEEGLELAKDFLSCRLKGFPVIPYLGISRFLRYRSIQNITEPWGWKDPRNTLTLPVWLKIFPKARIIILVRNGVDVAESLYRREIERFKEFKVRFEKYSFAAYFGSKIWREYWFGNSPKVRSREEGFQLWREYMHYAEEFTRSLKNPLTHIIYESFLDNPHEHLVRLSTFCNLKVNENKIKELCSTVRPERAYAFLKNSELIKLWERVRYDKFMRQYGYDDPIALDKRKSYLPTLYDCCI